MKTLCPNADCSWGHVLVGALAGFIPGLAATWLSLGFSAYELMRDKPESQKLTSLAEFSFGFLVGSVGKGLVR